MQSINLTLLSHLVDQYHNNEKSGKLSETKVGEYGKTMSEAENQINNLLLNLPSGSGIDSGITFDLDKSSKNKFVFTFGFHFMDDNGYYDACQNYRMVIIPTFGSYDLTIYGKNRRMIKDYFYQMFESVFLVSSVLDMYEERQIMFDTKPGIYKD